MYTTCYKAHVQVSTETQNHRTICYGIKYYRLRLILAFSQMHFIQ